MRNESCPHGDAISTCSGAAPRRRSSSAMWRECALPKRQSESNEMSRIWVEGAFGTSSANGSK